MLDAIGPLGGVICRGACLETAHVSIDGEGVMEMRGSSDIQGVAGQGTRSETAHVVDKIDDDHVDDFLGKPSISVCCTSLQKSTPRAHLQDSGQTSVPNPLGE